MADSAGAGGAMREGSPVARLTRRLNWLRGTLGVVLAGLFHLATPSVLAGERTSSQEPKIAGPEAMLIKTFEQIAESRMDSAMNGIDELLKSNPNFRLAHLIKGDLLLARARPINDLGNTAEVPEQHIADLRDEARVRVQRHRQPVPRHLVPRYLLQMQPEQKYAIIADTGRSRLYVFQNAAGKPRYIADYYISTGKNGSVKIKEGDKKTPVGVYFVTANVPREKLTDFYGRGAFPINYPNEWDRRHGRSGFGIWLHGTPSDTYSRPPRASDGCVVLANQDLERIGATLQVGLTPVIISDGVEWVDPADASALRDKLASHLESWRRAWESGNIEAYIRNYGRDFSTGTQNLAEWSRHKRQINANKNWIKVGISNVSMFLYPGRDDLVVVNFDQEYSSNNLSNRIKKRQYWMKEPKNESWKIIYE